MDEQPIIPDLQAEKLRLEIEEIKANIDDKKKSKVWDNYIKPIIPVAVTCQILLNKYIKS
jgi:hypothetical protein